MRVILIIVFILIPDLIIAQTEVWEPSTGHEQIVIWPGKIPDSQPLAGPEYMHPAEKLIANKPCMLVERVSKPTMTLYRPAVNNNTGAAVIVFPGGGYKRLAIDLEGSEICEWLASIGITGILLKYRVPFSGPYYDPECNCQKDAKAPIALEDAQRALGLVRYHASEWQIDPHKIGVIGFSAGGHLVADIGTHFSKRIYPLADSADNVSCRPDFGMVIYPGHMLEKTTKEFQLNPTLPVTKDTPPMFLLQAVNDPVDTVQNSLVFLITLKKAGVPVEYHLYPQGGHAFGLRKTDMAVTDWPRLAEVWLKTIGVVDY